MTGRNAWTVRLASAGMGLILLGFVVMLATRESGTGAASRSPLIGELVPAVVGVDLNGATFNVDDFSTGWVLINFFASWCVPCEREHPQLAEWGERHKNDGVVVSIPFGDTEQDARAFFAEHGGDWPVLMDKCSHGGRLRCLATPRVFLGWSRRYCRREVAGTDNSR